VFFVSFLLSPFLPAKAQSAGTGPCEAERRAATPADESGKSWLTLAQCLQKAPGGRTPEEREQRRKERDSALLQAVRFGNDDVRRKAYQLLAEAGVDALPFSLRMELREPRTVCEVVRAADDLHCDQPVLACAALGPEGHTGVDYALLLPCGDHCPDLRPDELETAGSGKSDVSANRITLSRHGCEPAAHGRAACTDEVLCRAVALDPCRHRLGVVCAGRGGVFGARDARVFEEDLAPLDCSLTGDFVPAVSGHCMLTAQLDDSSSRGDLSFRVQPGSTVQDGRFDLKIDRLGNETGDVRVVSGSGRLVLSNGDVLEPDVPASTSACGDQCLAISDVLVAHQGVHLLTQVHGALELRFRSTRSSAGVRAEPVKVRLTF
jgi:hypothetical protein